MKKPIWYILFIFFGTFVPPHACGAPIYQILLIITRGVWYLESNSVYINNTITNIKMHSKKRPLSPHIQIYRPQISSFTSILHRATGIFLYLGIVAICWVIVYYTYQVEVMMEGDIEEQTCQGCALVQYGLVCLIIAWSFSLYYHMFNGIRHLFWDIGKGFDKQTANRNGIIVIISAVLLTITSTYYAFFFLN